LLSRHFYIPLSIIDAAIFPATFKVSVSSSVAGTSKFFLAAQRPCSAAVARPDAGKQPDEATIRDEKSTLENAARATVGCSRLLGKSPYYQAITRCIVVIVSSLHAKNHSEQW